MSHRILENTDGAEANKAENEKSVSKYRERSALNDGSNSHRSKKNS